MAMGLQGDPRLLSSLKNGVTDPEQIVRTKVYRTLGEIGGEDAIPLLDQVIAQDPSWYARDYAYKARNDIDRIYKIVELF
jgi:HEAT repeat protein